MYDQLLRRLQPAVRVLRPLPADRAVNFGFTATRPLFAEHFPYQDGLIVSFWDTQFTNNNESVHPGQGEILPVDSHRIRSTPRRHPLARADPDVRRAVSLQKADSFTLHMEPSGPRPATSSQRPAGVRRRRSYWNTTQPRVGVKVPNAGVRMRVLSQDGTSMRVRVDSTK